MWVSKRYFLSIVVMFCFAWAGFDQLLQHQKSLDSRNSCMVIMVNASPRYLLDMRAGNYVVLNNTYTTNQFKWISAVSFDRKFIAYLQPVAPTVFTNNTYLRHFNLYIEELENGKRQLLLEDLVTSNRFFEQTAKLLWSPDDKLLTFFDRSTSPIEEGFAFVVDRDGRMLHHWEGGVYAPQWSHDGKYLSFSRFDFNSHKGTVNIFDRKSHQTKSYNSALFLQNTTTVWSANEYKILALDDAVASSNSTSIEYAISVISPEQENIRDIIVPFDHTDGEAEYNYADFDVTLDWRGYHPTIELRFRIGGKTWQTKEFDVATGEVVHISNAGFAGYSDSYYVDGKLVVLAELSDIRSHASREVIVLDYVPQKIFQVYFSFYDEVYPYWRLRNTRSIIVAWQYDENLYLTLYDIKTKETLTHNMMFPIDGNLQIEQIYGSELMSYQFIQDSVAYSGVFDTRKGEVLREFSDVMSNIPVFHGGLLYMAVPLEKHRIFAFSNEEYTVFINSNGEPIASKPGAQFFVGSPDETSILGIERSFSESSARLIPLIHYSSGQPSRVIAIGNLDSYYNVINWSPNSELLMVRDDEHINLVSKNGNVIWRFPRFSIIDDAEAFSFEWVRCDVFTRWRDIEVIDHGRAERG